MPRRSSGGGGGRSSRPAPRPAPRPQKVNQAPPPAPAPAPAQPRSGGIGSMIAEGMAFGGGNALAHRVFDSIMGPRTIQHETVVSNAVAAGTEGAAASPMSDSCGLHMKAFENCVNNFGSDISKCQFYMDMLADCRKNSVSPMSS